LINIGPYQLENRLILAPMAGVTDRPFRTLCRRYGAALAVSEMVIADPSFWHTRKSKHRLDHTGEAGPISVQIAGGDAQMLAHAAALNQEHGAQIIDINMGCPAKKVCNKAAGSALMRDESLVSDILHQVVAAVDIPVTLKMRTGWDLDHKNALTIAGIAESAGIKALAIHGRTRACKYQGNAEYETIRQVKRAVNIPVFANGDIDRPEKARHVLDYTEADGLLIGRAAQGRPWIFEEINHYLETGEKLALRTPDEIREIMTLHVQALHDFYGDVMGVRIARKHVGWYLQTEHDSKDFRRLFNTLDETSAQLDSIHNYFETKKEKGDIAA